MRGELHTNILPGNLLGHLFDLGGVAMTDDAVRSNGFRCLREQHRFLGNAPPAGRACLGINDDAVGFDQALLQEGQQRHQAGRWEAPRCSHQPGFGDGGPMPLRQAIDRLSAKVGVLPGETAGLL